MTCATSSTWPTRRTGIWLAAAAWKSSKLTPTLAAVAAVMSVAMKPGATALAVIAELAQLDREGLGEPLHAGLGRGVVDLAAVAQRGAGGQVDDPAVALLHHVPLGRAAHEERAAQVHAEHHVPVVLGHLEQQVVADDPGVVDQDRGRAEFGGDLADRGLHLVGLADVGAHGDRAAARRR